MGSFPYPCNDVVKINYEFILLFKKRGVTPKANARQKSLSKMTRAEWNRYFAAHWNIPGAKQRKGMAIFPEEIPARLIKMFSFVGETVLDPFLGSGTTSLAAKNLERDSIGYEINANFLPDIKTRLQADQKNLDEVDCVFLKDASAKESNVSRLPYVFHDHQRLDKRMNPKERPFGSRIDSSALLGEDFFLVKEIISPEVVLLDNGVEVRLLAVREKRLSRSRAMEFLKEKTRGRKVFLRFDEETRDEDNRTQGYLYLKNKTFLNAHTIKAGLASVDAAREFRHKQRFARLEAASIGETEGESL